MIAGVVAIHRRVPGLRPCSWLALETPNSQRTNDRLHTCPTTILKHTGRSRYGRHPLLFPMPSRTRQCVSIWWVTRDSNPVCHKTPDLQSGAVTNSARHPIQQLYTKFLNCQTVFSSLPSENSNFFIESQRNDRHSCFSKSKTA